jgi:hypothetical protein
MGFLKIDNFSLQFLHSSAYSYAQRKLSTKAILIDMEMKKKKRKTKNKTFVLHSALHFNIHTFIRHSQVVVRVKFLICLHDNLFLNNDW